MINLPIRSACGKDPDAVPLARRRTDVVKVRRKSKPTLKVVGVAERSLIGIEQPERQLPAPTAAATTAPAVAEPVAEVDDMDDSIPF